MAASNCALTPLIKFLEVSRVVISTYKKKFWESKRCIPVPSNSILSILLVAHQASQNIKTLRTTWCARRLIIARPTDVQGCGLSEKTEL